MKNFTQNLWQELQENLQSVRTTYGKEKGQYEEALRYTVHCLHELKQYTYSYNFKDKDEEILFNRELAPPFNTEYIYNLRCIKIIEKYEGLPRVPMKKVFLKEKKELNRFMEKNAPFYLYIKAGHRYLDEKFFLRGDFQLDIPFSEECLSIVDNHFVTISSYRLSQFIAYEKVMDFLATHQQSPDKKSAVPTTIGTPLFSGFKWTDKKIDLVELAYAICYKGSINRGNISVKEIALALGQLFNVQIDNILYQTRQQMLDRKAGDYYLESLMTALREGPATE